MIYFVEVAPYNVATSAVETLYFSSEPYMTKPGDTPANLSFRARVKDPGNYERHMYGNGRTRGQSDIGVGDIQLVNADRALDYLLDYAFDGRVFRITSLPDKMTPFAQRETVLVGTMDQIEFSGHILSIRIRDRLALLRENIQTVSFLGTTTAGSATVAEGNADMKDLKKPLLFGRCLNVTPILVDQFNFVYQLSSRALSAVTAVRDRGVLLTASSDYPTLAALRAATIAAGAYATCLALGLVRLQAKPQGVVTMDANEGATTADRSVSRIVQRMIAGIGAQTASDFDALHTLQPAEAGLWIGTTETTTLDVATTLLDSIGAYLTVDRFGVFRVGRLSLPSGQPVVTLSTFTILDQGEGISRQATNDEGDGVPARDVTLRYGKNWTTFTEADLKDVNATDVYRTFAQQEWRQEKKESAANIVIHPKGPQLLFDAYLLNQADASAEAVRLLALYSARRDLFRLTMPSSEVATVDLNDVVMVMAPHFGMSAGRLFRVIGVTSTFASNTTTLEVWS